MPAQGYDALLGIDSANPTTVAFEFLSESLGKTGTILDTAGLRGTRSHVSERTRAGIYQVGGSITMTPTPEEWAYLFPWILGANGSGTTYALAETLQTRYVQKRIISGGGTKSVATYAGCVVNRATIESSEGSPLQLTLDVVGTTETMGTTFPSITPAIVSGPFMQYEGVLTLQASTRAFRRATIVIDNALDVKFNNSQTASSITPTDRNITVSVEVPYESGNVDLYDQALAGAAATLVYTYSAYSLTFTFATLQVPAETPRIQGRGDVPLVLNMVARKLSTTNELAVTLDSTP